MAQEGPRLASYTERVMPGSRVPEKVVLSGRVMRWAAGTSGVIRLLLKLLMGPDRTRRVRG